MNVHPMWPKPISIITLSFLLIFVSVCYCEDDETYTECKSTFKCGNLEGLFYPFWSDDRRKVCGQDGFKLRCEDGQSPYITISDQEFRVTSVEPNQNMMTIARADYWGVFCPQNVVDTIDLTGGGLFNISPDVLNISFFYDCPDKTLAPVPPENHLLSCSSGNGPPHNDFYATDDLLKQWNVMGTDRCLHIVKIPFPSDDLEEILSGVEALKRVLEQGFTGWYKLHQDCIACHLSGGICGTNTTTANFTCLCRDQPHELICSDSGNDPNIQLKIGIGVGASLGSIAFMLIGFYIYLRRKRKGPYAPSSYVSQSLTSDYSSRSDMEKGSSRFGCHLFTYAELEQATNNFDSAKELGEGGFGTVYCGQLKDGRTVAVKRLYENNYKRVEQFMNEVDILTRLRHQNLVSLYGCTSRHSRELLLVYEYISNGTVADHLHGERARPGELPWCTRMKIAVETASALTYLHASDIIHRDVKTNNILLDNNFVVKVADFGLSRLFPMHVTHVSTAPQGTPGYVDPEYHECYQLTDKSDVYSYGVVLIELISSMPAVDITRHRHEINLSNMAINKIQSGTLHELVDRNLGFESDYAVRKMINAVAELAFQCLQSAKDLRPSMEEVLQTLKEIQTKDYELEKAEEMECRSDHVGLLKSGPIPLSPDTVMIKWSSTSTTQTNASG